MKINIKKTDTRAILPTRGSAGAAGVDLYALVDEDDIFIQGEIVIAPGGTHKFHTGIAVEIPEGYFGALYARSGLSTNSGLVLTTGTSVIDSDYRDEIIVGLRNLSQEYRKVYNGERIAQLVIQPYVVPEWNEVEKLTETERGTGGFGSTGS